MKIKFSERKTHFIFLAFFAGIFVGINFSYTLLAEEPAHKYLDYFHKVYQLIRTDYVEKIASRDIFYGSIKGMIKSLDDPYSRFLDETAYANLKEETTGGFVGIGVEITVRDGKVVVISPIEDTPAMRSGIRAGDIIKKVNGKVIKEKNISHIIKMIRGLPNSNVKLSVYRAGYDELIEFNIKRAPIRIKSVSSGIIEGTNIGFLKLKIFSTDTAREVEKALVEFNKKNVSHLVMDLRWNPGGLLDMAIKVSDLFLAKDKIIVSTRGREGSGVVHEYKSRATALFNGKIIILVNKGSASAAEILSGALRDNKRGELLGEKTFGKGSVQKFFNLNEKIGITLTIAKYYTPSGVSIHNRGIKPDHPVPMKIFKKTETKVINAIIADGIAKKFVKTNKKYDKETRKKFYQHLQDKKYKISQGSTDYILKKEILRYTKRKLYDLEFDNQLKQAIKILNAK